MDESSQPCRGGRNGHKHSQTVNTKRDGPCLGLQGPGEAEQGGAGPRQRPEPGILCSGPSRGPGRRVALGAPRPAQKAPPEPGSGHSPRHSHSCRGPGSGDSMLACLFGSWVWHYRCGGSPLCPPSTRVGPGQLDKYLWSIHINLSRAGS